MRRNAKQETFSPQLVPAMHEVLTGELANRYGLLPIVPLPREDEALIGFVHSIGTHLQGKGIYRRRVTRVQTCPGGSHSLGGRAAGGQAQIAHAHKLLCGEGCWARDRVGPRRAPRGTESETREASAHLR